MGLTDGPPSLHPSNAPRGDVRPITVRNLFGLATAFDGGLLADHRLLTFERHFQERHSYIFELVASRSSNSGVCVASISREQQADPLGRRLAVPSPDRSEDQQGPRMDLRCSRFQAVVFEFSSDG